MHPEDESDMDNKNKQQLRECSEVHCVPHQPPGAKYKLCEDGTRKTAVPAGSTRTFRESRIKEWGPNEKDLRKKNFLGAASVTVDCQGMKHCNCYRSQLCKWVKHYS